MRVHYLGIWDTPACPNQPIVSQATVPSTTIYTNEISMRTEGVTVSFYCLLANSKTVLNEYWVHCKRCAESRVWLYRLVERNGPGHRGQRHVRGRPLVWIMGIQGVQT